MDLGSRLANLSLAEIASMLNTKQQEVLLASISVAARFIQQLQAEEQQQQHVVDQATNLQLQAQDDEELNLQQQQHHHQQQHQQHNTNNNNQIHQQRLGRQSSVDIKHHLHPTNQDIHDDLDDEDEDDDDDEDQVDQSSDISFEDYSQNYSTHHRNTGSNRHHNFNSSTASSTADGETLSTIREFAEELKHRRKAIRLSQKGAAQSLRAYTNGEQPCTDAIIYHFENLQLEPDRAMQLIPLLRDWLEWAEKHKFSGKLLPMMSAVTKVPRERKRKVVLFNEKAKQYLEDAFLKNNHPDRYQLDVISQELNIPTRSIRKWFTNRRQRKRFAEKFSPVS